MKVLPTIFSALSILLFVKAHAQSSFQFSEDRTMISSDAPIAWVKVCFHSNPNRGDVLAQGLSIDSARQSAEAEYINHELLVSYTNFSDRIGNCQQYNLNTPVTKLRVTFGRIDCIHTPDNGIAAWARPCQEPVQKVPEYLYNATTQPYFENAGN